MIGLYVPVCRAVKGQEEQRETERRRDSWEIKTFWRFLDGCIHE